MHVLAVTAVIISNTMLARVAMPIAIAELLALRVGFAQSRHVVHAYAASYAAADGCSRCQACTCIHACTYRHMCTRVDDMTFIDINDIYATLFRF